MLTLATKFAPKLSDFEKGWDAGFRGVEFWLDAELLSQSDLIAGQAGQFSFRYALHFPNHGKISDENLQSAANLYRQLQCTAMVIHQPMFDRYGASLKHVAPEMDLAIENHVLDLTGFHKWADHSPGLTLDVEHLWKFTLHDAPLAVLLEQVDILLGDHSAKLHHVHLPGYQPGGEEHHPIHHSQEMAAEVLTRLADHGFTKLVVSEADIPFQSAEFLRQDVAWFEQWRARSQSNS